ncbi:MAG TPA: MarR family transcriptional regulator [Xanthobacteraceae bacterium]|jgi:DNA-binding MarR family transcriptional regulator|nr:MarR family transcriptional regulator [Xanthobacteraceae bacterium]
MSKDDRAFLDMPGHLIRRLHQISFALFVDQTKAFDITPVQYAAIAAINNHPGIDQTALSNIIAFDRTTIGDVVGRLEKKKLIRRLNGAMDRRTKSLHITALGKRLIQRISPAVAATQRLILAPLKPSERHAFMHMLKHLVHLNNARSRAPLRPQETRARRLRSAAKAAKRSAKSGRTASAVGRPRSSDIAPE